MRPNITSARQPTALPLAIVAIALPALVAYSLAPSATFLNQAAALVGWSTWMVALAAKRDGIHRRGGMTASAGLPQFALLMLVAVSLASPALTGLPLTIALSTGAVLLAAMMVMATATLVQRDRRGDVAFTAFTLALTLAGVLNSLIGVLQVYAPDLAVGPLIASSSPTGRAVGNLRQPNHLGSLLLWTLIAVAWLGESGRLRRPIALGAALLVLFGLVLTGSRTGMLGTLLLAAWGWFDRRQSRGARFTLGLAPVIYALFWLAVNGWAQGHGGGFAGEAQLHKADISSSRFAIWSNTLVMISQQPWTGVGFGEFNLAWTLTPFVQRPTAFFDHTHNLPLQVLVELGIPLGSLVLLLLLLALIQAGRSAFACDGDEGAAKRAAFMIVLMIGLHSMLEYPLWYAIFLLPTAFAWGFALAKPSFRADAGEATAPRMRRALVWGSLAFSLGGAAAILDYLSVAAIYDPPGNAAPLEDRIVRGQRSLLFGHHADYAAATAFGPPKAPLSPMQELAFRRAPHQLLDVRLMIAWSQALAAQGDLDKARWLAARIREFRNPGADEYFAPCQDPTQTAQAFQCQPPTREVQWREFTRR